MKTYTHYGNVIKLIGRKDSSNSWAIRIEDKALRLYENFELRHDGGLPALQAELATLPRISPRGKSILSSCLTIMKTLTTSVYSYKELSRQARDNVIQARASQANIDHEINEMISSLKALCKACDLQWLIIPSVPIVTLMA